MASEPEVTVPRTTARVGDYDLIRKLGAGGFGAVYEARHRDTGLPYALKRIELSADDAERFRTEALYPARIASESLHVMSVHSFFRVAAEDLFCLVTELIPHGDLRRFLDTNPKPLPLSQALEIAIGIAKGLAAIHAQGIVHRDLKPANVLMDRKDDRWVPKISDFGLARSTASVSLGEFATSGYAAPEQLDLATEQPLGPESDLFSLGMLLYELLTGRKPTDARDLRDYGRWIAARRQPRAPSEVRAELAAWPSLDRLVAELLEFDRDRRLASAADVVRSLKEVLRDVEHGDSRSRAESPERERTRPAVVDRTPADEPRREPPPADRWRVLATMGAVFCGTSLPMTFALPLLPDSQVSFYGVAAPFGFALGRSVVGTTRQAGLISVVGCGVYFLAHMLATWIYNAQAIPASYRSGLAFGAAGVLGAASMTLLVAIWHRRLARWVGVVAAAGAVGGLVFHLNWIAGFLVWQVAVGLAIADRVLFRGTSVAPGWQWRRTAAVGAAAAFVSVAGIAVHEWQERQPKPPTPGSTETNAKDGAEYVWIPPGEFQMGCSPDDNECYGDELPAHTVRFTRGLWLGRTEVALQSWKRIFPADSTSRTAGGASTPAMPVVNVTWSEAREYCAAADGRLPTEAEWEYAARAGTIGARYRRLSEIAWYADNAGNAPLNSALLPTDDRYGRALDDNGNRARDAGGRDSNPWSLADVLGNVAEWVEDDYAQNAYRAFAASAPRTDPPAHVTGVSDVRKVLRGGSWYDQPRGVRASGRQQGDATTRYTSVGFRCVWNKPGQGNQ